MSDLPTCPSHICRKSPYPETGLTACTASHDPANDFSQGSKDLPKPRLKLRGLGSRARLLVVTSYPTPAACSTYTESFVSLNLWPPKRLVVYVYIYICTYTHTYTALSLSTYIYIYMSTHRNMHSYVSLRLYAFACINVCHCRCVYKYDIALQNIHVYTLCVYVCTHPFCTDAFNVR